MTKRLCGAALALLLTGFAATAAAHFGMLIPDQTLISQDNKVAHVRVAFGHPMAAEGLKLERPASLTVTQGGERVELVDKLRADKFLGAESWLLEHNFSRPGISVFALRPKPYWEPAEDCFILHLTKTVVSAFGDDGGWEEPVGLEAEIVPLNRPVATWAGSVFRGRVLFDGKPLAGCPVEIEYLNEDGKRHAPSDLFETLGAVTDQDGVFAVSAPWPGWWGFAALHTAPYTLDHEGKAKEVEIGAVLWVKFADPAESLK